MVMSKNKTFTRSTTCTFRKSITCACIHQTLLQNVGNDICIMPLKGVLQNRFCANVRLELLSWTYVRPNLFGPNWTIFYFKTVTFETVNYRLRAILNLWFISSTKRAFCDNCWFGLHWKDTQNVCMKYETFTQHCCFLNDLQYQLSVIQM